MALTIAGAHVAVSSLASGCYSVVKGINELRQSWRYMPMTLSSMALACNTTSSTLKQVDLTLANYSGRLEDSYGELLDQFDGIKIGCAVTLSLLEKHVSDLLNIPNSGVPLKAQKTSATNKMKALYNESDMKELFRQLNVYITLLNTIQTHLQRYEYLIELNLRLTQGQRQARQNDRYDGEPRKDTGKHVPGL